MGGSAYRYTREHEQWVLDNLDKYPTQRAGRYGRALFAAFRLQFPDFIVNDNQLRLFCERVGSGQRIPESPMSDLREQVVNVRADRCLITSDWQIPYYDVELARKAFDLAEAWGVEHHIINGDLLDFASLSKFNPTLHDYRRSAGEEIELGSAIIAESKKRHGRVTVVPGNHEWRLMLRALQGQLTEDQVRSLITGDDSIAFTQLSFCILNDNIRVTHPGSASVVPGAVARALADRHQMNVIVAHGHGIGYARNYSGEWTAVESGGLFDPNRMDYSFSVDKRRPASNQGFVIVVGDYIRLVDPLNVDWAFEEFAARQWQTKSRLVIPARSTIDSPQSGERLTAGIPR